MLDSIIIRFITEPDFISRGIRDVTWSAFSHVEFVLDDGTMLGAHADGGVQIRPGNYCIPTNEERYRIYAPPNWKADVLAFAHAQVGKPYDFTDIFGILLHRDWRDTGHWICSELVAAAFETGNLPLLNAPIDKVNRISPRDIYLSPYLTNNRIFPI